MVCHDTPLTLALRVQDINDNDCIPKFQIGDFVLAVLIIGAIVDGIVSNGVRHGAYFI